MTYVLYSDEGHGFAPPENRIDFNARAEAFLAENLGGRCGADSRRKIPARRPWCGKWVASDRMTRRPFAG